MMARMRTRLTTDEIAVRDAFGDFFTNECPSAVVRGAATATASTDHCGKRSVRWEHRACRSPSRWEAREQH